MNEKGARNPEDIGPFYKLLVDNSVEGTAARAKFMESQDAQNGGYLHVSDYETWASQQS